MAYQQARAANHLTLRLPADVVVTPPAHPPHNVGAITRAGRRGGSHRSRLARRRTSRGSAIGWWWTSYDPADVAATQQLQAAAATRRCPASRRPTWRRSSTAWASRRSIGRLLTPSAPVVKRRWIRICRAKRYSVGHCRTSDVRSALPSRRCDQAAPSPGRPAHRRRRRLPLRPPPPAAAPPPAPPPAGGRQCRRDRQTTALLPTPAIPWRRRRKVRPAAAPVSVPPPPQVDASRNVVRIARPENHRRDRAGRSACPSRRPVARPRSRRMPVRAAVHARPCGRTIADPIAARQYSAAAEPQAHSGWPTANSA